MTHHRYALCSLLVLTLCVSCALSEEKSDEYRTIHESVLRSDMKTMANSLGVLANLHFETDIGDAQRQYMVIRELGTIEEIASGIGGDDVVTNYSIINRYMGAFLYDVSLAKQFANREPPNYIPANRLLNSCMSCHISF